jgi:REP element-mobilizing transposase RayT
MSTSDRDFRRHLPHRRREGAEYSVTWRLFHGAPPLLAEERDIVLAAIAHFADQRFALGAVVVMDDHVHLLARPFAGHTLSRLLHSWKSYSAHELVKRGRSAPVWQNESYDSIVRDAAHRSSLVAYIRDNPVKRWPDVGVYPWLLVPDQ